MNLGNPTLLDSTDVSVWTRNWNRGVLKIQNPDFWHLIPICVEEKSGYMFDDPQILVYNGKIEFDLD